MITNEQAELIAKEIKQDFHFFRKVIWNDDLETKAIELADRFFLKTLDAIQLAAGLLSRADVFVSSDAKLHREAEKVIKKVRFVG